MMVPKENKNTSDEPSWFSEVLVIQLMVSMLLNHELELRSSSLTFDKAWASSALCSLNHELFTLPDV